MALTLHERWVTAQPSTMVEWFVEISRERIAMITHDLGALCDEPVTLVEGPQLLPELLPDGARAIFLLAAEAFRRDAIGRRPFTLSVADLERAQRNRLERDRLLAEHIRAGAADRRLRVIEVDGSRTIEEVARDVGAELGSCEPAPDVTAVRRSENAARARQIRLGVASGEGPEVAPLEPFGCECGRLGCCEIVELAVDRFDARVAAGEAVLAHA